MNFAGEGAPSILPVAGSNYGFGLLTIKLILTTLDCDPLAIGIQATNPFSLPRQVTLGAGEIDMTPSRITSRRLAALRLPLRGLYDPLTANAPLRNAPVHTASELESSRLDGHDGLPGVVHGTAVTEHL